MKFAIGASVVALALVGAADAAELHVPAQYPTIQAAVSAAVTGGERQMCVLHVTKAAVSAMVFRDS
jgi:hypothetical protein